MPLCILPIIYPRRYSQFVHAWRISDPMYIASCLILAVGLFMCGIIAELLIVGFDQRSYNSLRRQERSYSNALTHENSSSTVLPRLCLL